MNEKIIIDETNEKELDDDKNYMFSNSTAFSQYIEKRSILEKSSCMNLILDFCEKRFIDIEDVIPLFSKQLKEKLKNEMIQTGMVKEKIETLDGWDG